ncbi:hypothetical protein C9397_04075 [Xanthomonas vasicola pv. vasculorum]|uniref:Uncharacterized protein n=3 Tax=Xanthomonas vasicola TaxID=56459 RepID=A0A837AP80_XANVA|nr:hypothetical protein C7V42_06150 [Xanthomonas vasicola pv. vasculorum]KFA28561.1 hypothetical protein KW5_0109940 [Xanthomonas vasicola pv. vasculorum NCPPB 1326]TWQ11444.1 hypothetical protein FQK02_16730 [Xanthomonas vasicola]HHZ48522.1 hypothetical protein [Xanthomonas vasicola pv. zeae]AZM73252.1 hypothetical protein CXP37_06155 [Xanthomonas vasicola pv. vasculorum]
MDRYAMAWAVAATLVATAQVFPMSSQFFVDIVSRCRNEIRRQRRCFCLMIRLKWLYCLYEIAGAEGLTAVILDGVNL